jgi:hypothetical protein
MHLPLHAPVVTPLNLDKFNNPVMRSWVNDLGGKTKLRKRQKTKARQEDVNVLLQSEILERCTKEQIRMTGSLFSVVEEQKKRRRAIYWPKSLNLAVDHMKPEIELEDTIAHARVEKNLWAATFDLKASFYQVELPEPTRSMFGLHTDSGCFRFKRLPMGFSISPYIMNEITKQAASEAQCDNLKTDVYIDNVRFTSSSKSKVEEACVKFKRFCEQSGVTLNEEEGNKPHHGVPFWFVAQMCFQPRAGGGNQLIAHKSASSKPERLPKQR